MGVEIIIIEKLVEFALSKSIIFFKNIANKPPAQLPQIKQDLQAGLAIQIKKAINFAGSITFFKTPSSKKTDTYTVELSIKNQYRHFSCPQEANKYISERELLLDPNNHILLGDPGSGKTTTMKRLLSQTFLNIATEDIAYFPVIVRLGEVKRGDTLATHLCKELGIAFEAHEKKVEYDEIIEEYGPDCDSEGNLIIRQHEIKKTKTEVEYKIGNLSVENAIGKYLDEIKAALFIDGLDEVHFDNKENVFNEIKRISNLVVQAKLILTSRYLEDIRTFKKFKINEILPLSPKQATSIAELWVDNVDLFFKKLEPLPYRDLANRPLFLYLLLLLFDNNNEELPEQAVDVYRQIILLIIREWDEDREYKTYRYSKYKKFDTYKKEDFLSEIAFHLIYAVKTKKFFSEKQLKAAYLNVYGRYPQLGPDDMRDVIADIEAHNGLIIKSLEDRFEFCHLSLEEYLCAKFLLTIPFSKKHFEYFNIDPAPFAIATVMSPKTNEWFSMLFLNNIREFQIARTMESDKIYVFIQRLLLENIVFPGPTVELGFAVLFLLFRFSKNKEVYSLLTNFLRVKYVKESVAMGLLNYTVLCHDGGFVELELKKNTKTDLYIDIPAKGRLNYSFYKSFDLANIR